MQDIQPGDDVIHNDYPIGILAEIRMDVGNGAMHGLVQIHGHADDAPSAIPMHELKRDFRSKTAIEMERIRRAA